MLGGLSGHGKRDEIVQHAPTRSTEAQVIRVKRSLDGVEKALQLGHVRVAQRIDATDRHGETMRGDDRALAYSVQRVGEVPAAPHVVFRGDLEEVDAGQRPLLLEHVEGILQKLPPEP